MVVCYAAILWKLDRYEAQVLRREHPISVTYKTRVAKTLFVVVLTFVVLRVPFTVMVFARHNLLQGETIGMNQVDGSFSVLWYTSHYLIFLHAAVNPLIYGLTNANFRRAYAQTPLWFGGSKQVRRDAELAARKMAGQPVGKRPHGHAEQKPNGVPVRQALKPTVTRLMQKLQPRAACGGNEQQQQRYDNPTAPRCADNGTELGTEAAVPVVVGRGWTWLNTSARLREISPTTTFMGSPMCSKATMVTNVKFTASGERDVDTADARYDNA